MTSYPNIERFNDLDAELSVIILRQEHPQTLAATLLLLDSEVAANILENFTSRLRDDVILRMTCIDRVSTAWLKKLDESYKISLDEMESNNPVTIKNKSIDILRKLKTDVFDDAINDMKVYDPELAQQVVIDTIGEENACLRRLGGK